MSKILEKILPAYILGADKMQKTRLALATASLGVGLAGTAYAEVNRRSSESKSLAALNRIHSALTKHPLEVVNVEAN